jgi:hypothetical protein
MRRRRRLISTACIVGLCVLALAGSDGTSLAQPLNSTQTGVDLTGVWRANDGGTYWIRQINKTIWWVGFSGRANTTRMGLTFSNVFNGTLKTPTFITGQWADVPRGATRANGTLTLIVRGTTQPYLTRRTATGGFVGSIWRRSR